MKRGLFTKQPSRRDALYLIAGTGVISLVGCDDSPQGQGEGGVSAGSSDPAGGVAGTPVGGASTGGTGGTGGAGGAGGAGGGTPSGGRWASGGTAPLGSRPESPFTAPATACAVVGSTTQGPCTTSMLLDREDISEGWVGAPVWVALRVIDSACAPLVGAQVSVWHTNVEGSYSGQTPNNNMCLQDQAYAVSDFFRGVQTTDEQGVVWFKTCFPGWYPGRAIHIHFQVLQGDASTKVSQLFFPEDVIEELFASHVDYAPFGQPDRSLSTDGVASRLSEEELAQLTFEVTELEGGLMLASQTVAVV